MNVNESIIRSHNKPGLKSILSKIKEIPNKKITYLAPALAMLLSACNQTQVEWSLVGAGVVLFFIGLSVVNN